MVNREQKNRSLITIHRSPSAKNSVFGAVGAGFIVVVFCLLLLWHAPLLFWNDDYELSILPVFADVARSWSHGEWPLLSPYSWVCGNLAGEYQYGTVSVDVSSTGRRAFDRSSVCARDGRLSARARTKSCVAALNDGCARRRPEWL